MANFAKVNIDIIQDETLSHHARMVYTFLCTFVDFVDSTKPVFVKTATIAGNLLVSHTVVKRALKELTDAGIIRRERRYRQSAFTYILK